MRIHFVALPLLVSSVCFAQVRRVSAERDRIIPVRTAIVIATIIQVPDRLNSVVIGDPAAFKLEFLDQAVTIKPLKSNARSNLYLYTDWARFNVQLTSVSQTSADFVVYLESPRTSKPRESSVRWSSKRTKMTNGDLIFETTRSGPLGSTKMFIEFKISATKPQAFRPEWLWLTQNRNTVEIRNLTLSGLAITKTNNISGVIEIDRDSIDSNQPFQIELRTSKTSTLSIPKVVSWK